MKDVKGRLAFVTGGASGIGFAIASTLLENGGRVVIADLKQDHIEEARAALNAKGFGDAFEAVQADVIDRERLQWLAADIEARLGGADILVNNAGVGISGPFSQTGYDDWDFGLGVNLGGVVNGLQSFLPGMRARRRGGHVVNTASLAATLVMPSDFAVYTAAKAAVIALSESIAGNLAEAGIGVSILLPGFVRSNLHRTGEYRQARFRQDSGFRQVEQELAGRQAGDDWMDPAEVGKIVLRGIINNELYLVTHGNFRAQMQARFDALLAATPAG